MAHPDSFTFERFVATAGYDALRFAVSSMSPSAVHEAVRASGLTGRSGGAAFPTASKWDTVPEGAVPFLVVNGDESEPGTFKDRQLMERDPHQLLEGALLAAYAIGARFAILYVRGEMALARERLTASLVEAREFGAVGERIFGSEFSCDMVVHAGAGAYIVGEETALLTSLEGERGMPRVKPPHPTAQGLYARPTVVNNVDTLSMLPWIVRHGGEAFAALGGARSTGTRVFSVSGRVRRPGNYEVPLHKTTFKDLLFDPKLAGGIIDDRPLVAWIPGASFPWLFPEHLDTRLDIDDVTALGTQLGSGIMVLDDTVCPLRVVQRFVHFFAEESCGKCTPCREGTGWLDKILYRINAGHGRPDDLDLLSAVGDNISPGPYPGPPLRDYPGSPWPPRQTTICPLGPSAIAPISSTLRRFHDEYAAHIKHDPCAFAN
jgi:NADH-quinone oxidoreductase subunit F